MACTDVPCATYMALYIVSMHIINSNSRTSSHWRLNFDEGKVVTDEKPQDNGLRKPDEDLMLNILTTARVSKDGEWVLEMEQGHCADCKAEIENPSTDTPTKSTSISTPHQAGHSSKYDLLSCGKPVNTTPYDHLQGIANRKGHIHIPEPEVAMIFKKKGSRSSEVDMSDLERRLRKSRREKPRSAQVFNQIGNYWRIKGNTQLSIECFRKALSISPNNPDVLLNLARVLFNLQFLDDAIFLTRKSLELQTADQNSWLQHFTLGEILKAYGHFHEAALHFRHTLDLNPGFQPAQAHLREMEMTPDPTVTYYTLFIILFLVLGVLVGILTSLDANLDDYGELSKTQRHFNRAMAMRSIKLGINPKLMRMRKCNC
ncbi:tetratricopeptide repeat protein 17 [Lingula anatina]|uniref:Tetratricopeptide repeat protein 17 n=1 Tax=Lingula anatina TaxID=7574 RepID=A0A1S3HIQ7_LINAN|nr:tetratricopeptide repeat protein 17 [Lingula anatina]|eukprot:XP_013385892.1 tetratricopeptide repeat protein 17 [Lingula anatina]